MPHQGKHGGPRKKMDYATPQRHRIQEDRPLQPPPRIHPGPNTTGPLHAPERAGKGWDHSEDQELIVRWTLTEKGEDTLPILTRLMAFGSKWYAKEVFDDKIPRSLNEIFTKPEAQEIVQRLYES